MTAIRRDLADLVSGQRGRPIIGESPEWMEQGLCAQVDPERWFPEKGGSTREAISVCRRCPVRDECLEYALEHGERFGIWGGLAERPRRKLERLREAS